MLTTRLFISPITRFTLLVVALLLCACALSFVFAPGAAACPSVPPTPLRPLYIASKRVVVARAGQSALLPTVKEENYEATPLRTTFYVSQTLKGEGEEESVVHVYRTLYGEERAVPEELAEGTKLLLFLREHEGGGYEITDTRYGAKKLSEEDLKIYVKRLEELAVILRDEKPDKKKIVDWLVRCAEEKATRWEGAYELGISQSALVNAEKKAGQAKEESAGEAIDGEAAVAASELSSNATGQEVEAVELTKIPISYLSGGEYFLLYNPELARLLTSDHKKRLADTLFNLQEFSDKDAELFELVLAFGADDRTVPFIVSQLNRIRQEPPYYAQQLMAALAQTLGDDALIARAEKYNDNAMYYDPEEEEEVEAEEGQEDVESVDEEERALTGNAAQKRSARLQKFLAEAERVINNRIALGQ